MAVSCSGRLCDSWATSKVNGLPAVEYLDADRHKGGGKRRDGANTAVMLLFRM